MCADTHTGLMDISKTCDDDECSCIITMEEEKEKKEKVVVAEDLILEILFRLPSFSVFRFKFVCKSWYSLISNPDLLFLKHHHHHHQRLLDRHSDDFLFITNNSMVDKHEVRQHNPPEYVLLPQHYQNQQLKVFLDHALSVFIPQKFSSSSRLIDSCNGLLLYCTENNPISGTGVETTQYHVFNPITKQCFELPMMDRFGNNLRKGSIDWLHIVFDPSVSLSFKVLLCLAPDLSNFYSRIYVYSSSSSETSSSWKYLAKFEGWKYSHFRAVLLDGFLYLYKSPYKLLCFDVVKNKFWFLSLPLLRRMESRKKLILRESFHGCGDLNLLYFGELGGRLRLIRRNSNDNSHGHRRQGSTSAFRFYVMELELKMEVGHDRPKVYFRKWTVKHRVDIKVDYEDMAAQIIHIYKTGAAGKKGEEEEDEDEEEEALLFLNRERNMVIPYNLTSNTFGTERKISNFDHFYDLDAFRFTPTLLPFSC